ncbi:MAG: vWA domain-containing protein [Thermodesulfobacteriota bacterium]|nr:vWA domain-containing protein [Thermodesulfobacteriota bacterium]
MGNLWKWSGNSLLILLIYFCFVLGADVLAAPVDLVIVLDRSGSMAKHLNDPKGLAAPAAAFILEQLSLMGEDNRAAIVPFNDYVMVLGQKTADVRKALTRNIPGLIEMLRAGTSDDAFEFRENAPENPADFSRLLRSQMNENGETELDPALNLAGRILAEKPERQKVIVLLSDGKPEVNYKDRTRLQQLGEFLGMDLIKRYQSGGAANVKNQINKKYADYILDKTIKELIGNNISILPIAFEAGKRGSKGLAEFLKQIREMSEGDKNVPLTTSSTLIQKLMDFLPSGANHIQLHKGINFIEKNTTLTVKEHNITIPKFSNQVRFLFSFPNSHPAYKVGMKFYHNDKLVTDTGQILDYEVIHTRQRQRDNSLVYLSFRFKGKDITGKWRIELMDQSKAQAQGLPQTDLLIDVRADLNLEIQSIPQPDFMRTREPVEFKFTLFGGSGSSAYAIPLKKIDAFLLGRKPESISSESNRIRNIKYAKASTASWDKFDHPGLYMLKGWAYFIPKGFSGLRLKVYFKQFLKVQSADPVEAWFSYRGSRQKIPESKLPFPALGEELFIDFSNLLVQTSSKGYVSELNLKLEPLVHENLGVEASSWIYLKTGKIKRISKQIPFTVPLSVKLPEVINPDLPDGNYKTVLSLNNGITELDSLEIIVPVKIPRLVADKENINKLFAEKKDNPVITFENAIYYPGPVPHHFEIPLWNTSNSEASVSPFFPFVQGVKILDQAKNYLSSPRNDKVLFSHEDKVFLIPEKNAKKPGVIKASVVLQDDSLNGNSYMNMLHLKAERHRIKNIKLITHIKFVPRIYLLAMAGLSLFLSLIMLLKFKTWWKNRKLFEGFEGDQEHNELDCFSMFRKERLGGVTSARANATDKENSLLFQGRNWNYCVVKRNGGVKPQDSKNRYMVNTGDTIEIEKGKKIFHIRIDSVPKRLKPNDYRYSINKSMFNNGNRMWTYLISGFIFALFGLYMFVWPYGILKLLQL